jgi:transcriptional regulator with XRE-family HTH domain
MRKALSDERMERLPEKVLALLQTTDQSAAKVARAIKVDGSQFSKWLRGIGKPTVPQLLGMARALHVSMEYLADDQMVADPEKLTPDERMVLTNFQTSELTGKEAVKWIQKGIAAKARKEAATPSPSFSGPRLGSPENPYKIGSDPKESRPSKDGESDLTG